MVSPEQRNYLSDRTIDRSRYDCLAYVACGDYKTPAFSAVPQDTFAERL